MRTFEVQSIELDAPPADAFRYLALVWTQPHEIEAPQPFDFKNIRVPTFDEIVERSSRPQSKRI